MLDFIYYPVSGVLWLWHTAFAAMLGTSSGLAWVLAIVFLVLTLRALLIRPFLAQLRFQRTLAKIAPEMREIQRKYQDDRQRQAEEVRKLQQEHSFNPLLGFLPMIGQLLVFIGLFHVLNSFHAGVANYVFSTEQVRSFLRAELFGAPLSLSLSHAGDALGSVAVVAIPLVVIAAIATHCTARFSVARQRETAPETAQIRVMNLLSMWVFPLGTLLTGVLWPVAILLYFLAQNAWTFAQQNLVYRRFDAEIPAP
ncbi:membrane protein insertase YidC [Nocardia acidivorans]|uniref:membrane protein insertase YidC n=1 Tax=Nocardia acidivorans TaxID=404580 RepID=UPI0008304AEE|nr:membrane protein insertase YidC [Nocardia acidivorans]